MERESKYIYAIIKTDGPREFKSLGIGGRGDKVYTVPYHSLAAVVSSSPIVKYPVSRDNTMAHQKILEEVMKEFTLLPVRFGCIAEQEKDIQEKVLKSRYQEFTNLLAEMKGKVELGVRAFWTEMEKVFAEIVIENKLIASLKKKIEREKSAQKVYAGKMKIGEMVEHFLEEKKKKEADRLLRNFTSLAEDYKQNRVLGDRNILNAAFLVNKKKEKKFDRQINKLAKELGNRTKLNYFGPIPPYSFVEVVVNW